MVLTEQRLVGPPYHSASGDGGDKKERVGESDSVESCFDGIRLVLITYESDIIQKKMNFRLYRTHLKSLI